MTPSTMTTSWSSLPWRYDKNDKNKIPKWSYVRVPAGVEAQDETGRLWGVLWMLRQAIRRSEGGDLLSFQLHVRNRTCVPGLVTLKAVCGPDDDVTPCITVMLPDED